MSPDLVLRTQDLGKAYRIWRRPEDRLKQMLFPRRRFYDEFWALRHVNLEVGRGEAVGLIGRNGAGKSTLLQLACGTLEPSTGTIERQGRFAALLELGAGFNPEFTGRENVVLSAMVMGLSRDQIAERFDAIADFAAIGDFMDFPVKTYSSGMYARLAFAVAAHVDADVLIVDEILSVGDISFSQKCMRFIRSFCERGTLLFVSHSPDAVLSLCNRAVWLEKGEVREMGPAKDVCRAYVAAAEREKDNASAFQVIGRQEDPDRDDVSDHRAVSLASEGLSSQTRVFAFDPNSPWFGRRGASIVDARIINVSDPASLPSGGDEVMLQIECEAHTALYRPIVGFYVRDRLGQALFGDNTYWTFRGTPLDVAAGERFTAQFRFRLPYLPQGEYVVNAALADGTQEEHVQHHWADEAMILTVGPSHVQHGLVGIPMLDIQLEKSRHGASATGSVESPA
ncbi:MAG TPA: ABC transporter ATP-binding protein [Acetobacteraceae bacterium]|nr:ABC transporter ATP-binding protein [Acetobacteraceae bacterium]